MHFMNSAKISIIKKYVITKYVLIKECEGIKHMKTTELEKKKRTEKTQSRDLMLCSKHKFFLYFLF